MGAFKGFYTRVRKSYEPFMSQLITYERGA